jgi:hypothetical protein
MRRESVAPLRLGQHLLNHQRLHVHQAHLQQDCGIVAEAGSTVKTVKPSQFVIGAPSLLRTTHALTATLGISHPASSANS